MPRRSKGPRLYFRSGRINARNGERIADVWVIRDGAREVSTGCGLEGLSGPGGAEEQLADYLATKWRPAAKADSRRDPDQVLVAEVLALYASERAETLKLDARTLDGFVRQLLNWWGDRPLSDVKRSTCQAYVAHRTSMPHGSYKDPSKAPRVSSETARRELETLSGAIGYWHGEDQFSTRPVVWLPEKPESPRSALTRPQAAALLKAAMGYRMDPATGKWKRLGPTARTNRLHLRRFILLGLYSGSRHNVMRTLLWAESATHAWVDLDNRMIYRRGRKEKDQPTKRRTVVKIAPRLAAHMRRWRRIDAASEARRRADGEKDFRIVSVLHYAGVPLAGKIRTAFESCVADAGLPLEVTPHWMRHTAATWFMEKGVDMFRAAGWLGMTTRTLEDHYAHHRPDFQDEATAASTRKA